LRKDGRLTIAGALIAGSGAVQLTTDAGKIQAISSTYFDSLSGANLTGIVNSCIDAGAAIAWSKISKTGSSLADLATRSASDLSSGTLPDGRFPATLPAASGANLTALNASNVASGTLAQARLGSLTGAWATVTVDTVFQAATDLFLVGSTD